MSAVNVFVTSPDTRSERRFDLHITIEQLKGKLELITGIPVENQVLHLVNSLDDTRPIAALSEDSRPLGYYGVRDYQAIKVDDLNPATSFTGQLTDTSQVDKFELTEEEYSKRADTVLAYKQRMKMGRFAEKEANAAEEAKEVAIPVGSRCEIESNEAGLHKRGTVRFVGPTKFGTGGTWVGVEYDEPMGKNDGSVQGERYFTCAPKYGVFVRPEKVKVGDFPPEELDLDDDEEM
ncbi:CAP Gly-rich domain-containing protein [Schizophyllum amplum]|uniref:CAP Gly-rich domain-containing protein n=1 Tax=Schizophyllum amplum TaxID=97359 RepID=A0A550C208_9AGAR|nr:CAP Gly-rich domain-containing protein [Auriculariopsis ampla]